MECVKCGASLPQEAQYCWRCGYRAAREMECVKCGASLPAEARYCWRCGQRAAHLATAEMTVTPNPEGQGSPGELRWSHVPAAAPGQSWPGVEAASRGTVAGSRWRYASGRGLATAIAVLAAFAALGFGLDALLGLALATNPRTETYDALGVGTVIGALAAVPMAVLFIICTRRVTGNLEVFGVERTWGTGWAIGAWFVPVASLLLPIFVINQAYKATTPELEPPVGTRWRSRPSSPLFWAWWALWVVGNSLTSLAWNLYDEAAQGGEEELVAAGWGFLIANAPIAAAAVLAAVAVRQLTARQDEYARRWLQLPV